jgi:hypothetical protein
MEEILANAPLRGQQTIKRDSGPENIARMHDALVESAKAHKCEGVRDKLCVQRDWRFNSFPRADSLLKTRRETRTVHFIGICRRIGIRQIDGARSNFYLAVRVSGIPRQKSVDS